MARTTTRKAKAAKRAAPAATLRKFTLAARKALVARIDSTRKLAVANALAARKAALARAGEARSRTVEAVTHLERVFEARVGAAVARLGVPSARDVRALSRQVAELQASVERLKRTRAKATA